MQKAYDVQLVVEKKKHFYDVTLSDGKELRFSGVTGNLDVINKPALVPWAKKESLALVREALIQQMDSKVVITRDWIEDVITRAKKRPDKIRDDAADLGTRAHAFIDLIVHNQEPPDLPPELVAPIGAFKEWWKASGIELVMGDTKVASLLYKYGGSLDALGRRDGKFIILDWKTSSGIFPEMALQTSAYAQAFYETYGLYCQEAIICRFGKKLPIDFETRKVRNLEQSLGAFLAAKALKEAMEFEHFEERI